MRAGCVGVLFGTATRLMLPIRLKGRGPLRHAARQAYTERMLDYEISPRDAAQLFKEKQARIIDVREPWEFTAAHIQGSVPMPMGEVPARAHQELDPDERLLLLCHYGVRSMNVTVWLRNQGFEQAQSLRGGIDAWSVEVDPTVSRY